ncbi:MAG: YifB family Mg chelatase-like AAA ATPase [Clostridiaceae bacterium]|nr:YifB family Mg chelatase-like AAA ATPase [Clostridiaceae bacterium]
METKHFSQIKSCALYGIQGILVDIEVSILPGLPSFEIVGLGDSAVRESRNRVHAAIKNNGYAFPAGRVIASYAPAWLRKEGTAYDLPLALALLAASGQIAQPDRLICVFGELSLNGAIRGVPGVVCRALTCKDQHITALLVPAANFTEANSVMRQAVFPIRHLQDAVRFLGNHDEKSNRPAQPAKQEDDPGSRDSAGEDTDGFPRTDICQIIGQEKAIRALQIAAAGWHNLLLLGSPGCGKTSLASTIPGLLPALNAAESMQVTRIYSASGLLKDGRGLIRRRPFRAPYHTASRAALIGGGSIPVPGEVTLAHLGILFLDEMTEFQPEMLDLLRQPMENRTVRLVRLRHSMVYPADFLLVGAANPCRCGEYLENNAACRCTREKVLEHLNRISGPLLDRIDLTVEMTRLPAGQLEASLHGGRTDGLDSAGIARQISRCWEIQFERCRQQGREPDLNGRLKSDNLSDDFFVSPSAVAFAARSAGRLNLSVRSCKKTIRIARTIADLSDSPEVREEHVAEALQFRFRWPEP